MLTTSPSSDETPCASLKIPPLTAAVAAGHDQVGIRQRRQGLTQWAGHPVRHDAGHEKPVRVAGRGDESSAESLDVKVGTQHGGDLEFTAVARAHVHVSQLQ